MAWINAFPAAVDSYRFLTQHPMAVAYGVKKTFKLNLAIGWNGWQLVAQDVLLAQAIKLLSSRIPLANCQCIVI